ncbi:type II toxin-antitoxin system RelE/ParE family toxin [Weeksellaceae bacterium TAE3-ERU29]|nr:type II toxin-antitoxin system RelE/ParE family toxin [Weeksellaceae bacterium TAE3-ERU29]
MRVVWENSALEDLENAINYIANKSPQNAVKVLDTLLALSESLVNMPYKYPKEPHYNKESIRFVAKWSFKMIYQVDDNQIIVLRLFNTYQDPNKLYKLE